MRIRAGLQRGSTTASHNKSEDFITNVRRS